MKDKKDGGTRLVSNWELLNRRPKRMGFEGEWLELVGDPERTGCWILYGGSGCGKTNFAMQVAKYLMQFERVLYNAMEEGAADSLTSAVHNAGIAMNDRRIQYGDRIQLPELIEVLERHKSPNIVVIDTIQFMDISAREFRDLIHRFKQKLFVIVSHVKNGQSEGVGDAVLKMASVKWFVGNNGVAVVRSSRYRTKQSKGVEYVFYEEKYREMSEI
jgi:KaiC/GvpD/RAD55 family RecA-like ATPase